MTGTSLSSGPRWTAIGSSRCSSIGSREPTVVARRARGVDHGVRRRRESSSGRDRSDQHGAHPRGDRRSGWTPTGAMNVPPQREPLYPADACERLWPWGPAAEGDADALLEGFLDWVSAYGIELYPAQEEAVLELLSDNNVILTTPRARASRWSPPPCTSRRRPGPQLLHRPIKALVNEKFFALCRFGPDNVGMITGDAAVNADAPIVCCTAEILANMALREGDGAVDRVPRRVPLLRRPARGAGPGRSRCSRCPTTVPAHVGHAGRPEFFVEELSNETSARRSWSTAIIGRSRSTSAIRDPAARVRGRADRGRAGAGLHRELHPAGRAERPRT